MIRKTTLSVLGAAIFTLAAVFEVHAEGASDNDNNPEKGSPDSEKKPTKWDYRRWHQSNGKDAILRDLRLMEAFTFDPSKGEVGRIRYRMTEPARVRIRIGSKYDPRLVHRTLVHWAKQLPGRHVEEWDGRDASGNLLVPGDCRIRIKVEPEGLEIEPVFADEILNDPHHRRGHVHMLHGPDKCSMFDFRIASHENDDAVGGTVSVECEPVGSFEGYAVNWGYGIHWYVDDELVKEGEIGPSEVKGPHSFALDLDTTALENGWHRITVNICDHNDHVGAASVILDVHNGLRSGIGDGELAGALPGP